MSKGNREVNIPVYIYDFKETKFRYIRSGDMPEAERERFRHWMRGQTRPIVPGMEGEQDASYLGDYIRFIEGLPIID